ncbi:hypothetical protein HPP92_009224 [Vanilla planifolia]|uniref:Uncharacterized protein n=1 Tax=Vanilla planifolia TaxID=51239 RepID=A0A835RBZ5_VANPL|nr:hypothetical protein HPP92_009224 [Vanilla planifolia]
MRVLNWIQNKLNGKKQENRRFEPGTSSACNAPRPEDNKEGFSDWPEGFLSIGTLGNNGVKEEQQSYASLESSQSAEAIQDFTIDEVIKLQKELGKLLKHKAKCSTDGSDKGVERANLPLNRFLNCPSSLEVDRGATRRSPGGTEEADSGDLSPYSKLVLGKFRELLSNNRNAIKQKSVPFLLKKMFACKGGFVPRPSLREPIPESRMEKLLRLILQKKIHQQNSAPLTVKKYLKEKSTEIEKMEDEGHGGDENRGKWVKTDSNCTRGLFEATKCPEKFVQMHDWA